MRNVVVMDASKFTELEKIVFKGKLHFTWNSSIKEAKRPVCANKKFSSEKKRCAFDVQRVRDDRVTKRDFQHPVQDTQKLNGILAKKGSAAPDSISHAVACPSSCRMEACNR